MYQRAWYTAQAMGIGEANHQKMFAAVWETKQVALLDAENRIRKPLPTIQEAARFYARTASVKEAEFLKIANSPAINAQMKRADQLIATWRVPGTPAIVINGRYLINNDVAQKWEDIQAVTLFLVGLERQRLALLSQQPAKKP